jgi:hypothetical protein
MELFFCFFANFLSPKSCFLTISCEIFFVAVVILISKQIFLQGRYGFFATARYNQLFFCLGYLFF